MQRKSGKTDITFSVFFVELFYFSGPKSCLFHGRPWGAKKHQTSSQNASNIYPKTGPGGFQMAKKSVQNRCKFFLQNPASMLVHFGSKMGAKMEPEIYQKSTSQPDGPPRAAQRPRWNDPPCPSRCVNSVSSFSLFCWFCCALLCFASFRFALRCVALL